MGKEEEKKQMRGEEREGTKNTCSTCTTYAAEGKMQGHQANSIIHVQRMLQRGKCRGTRQIVLYMYNVCCRGENAGAPGK